MLELLDVIASEVMKIKKNKMSWIGTTIVVLLPILLILKCLFIDRQRGEYFEWFQISFVVNMLALPIVSGFVITVIIQKEYQDNTLRNVLLAPTSRTDFVISKIVIWALWYVITLGLIEVVIGAGLYILYPQEFNLKNLGYTIYFLTEYGIFSFISMLPILWVAFKQKHLFYPSMLITLGFTALELAGRQVNEEMLELASVCPWTAVSVSGMVEVKSIHFWICAVSIFICGVVGILGSVSTFKKQNL